MKFDYRSLEVFVGVDMAKQHHYALAVTTAGTEVFHRPVLNDQTAIGKLIVDASKHGRVALVIDMHTRFKDGGRLAAYAGLAPVDRRSGKSINNAAASRRGNRRSKNAMFLAAFVATQHDPNAKAYYQRKRAEGKGHNAAVICVARRRYDLIHAMPTTSQAYDPHRSENQAKAA